MTDLSKCQHLIGHSLSFCIRDVIEGRVSVEQIDRIVASTLCENDAHWDEVIEHYREIYWQADPDRAERITRQLRALGLIDQPRVRGEYRLRQTPHWEVVR
jgi:hypothetical protein